jgi:hypothetical protein
LVSWARKPMAIKEATMMTTSAERVRSLARSPAVKLARPTAITWIQGVGECVLVRRAANDTMTMIGRGRTAGRPRAAGRRGRPSPISLDLRSTEVSRATTVSATTGPSAYSQSRAAGWAVRRRLASDPGCRPSGPLYVGPP